jgi:ATP-dependent protease ClpP protease subunit
VDIEQLDTYPKFNLRGSIGPSVSDGILDMFGGPETISPSDLRAFLDENKDASVIVLEISSPGGYINEAVEMFDMLRASGKEVVTIGYRVNSAATVVQLAGDERFCAENAECVIHKAAVPPEALVGGPRLTDDELKKLAQEGTRENKRILDLYTKVLGKDKEQPLMALMSVETNLGAKGMIKYGFANKIYKPKKKVPLDNLKARAYTITPAFINLIEKKNSTPMSKDNSALEKKFDAFMAKIEKMFKGKAFTSDVPLTTSDGKTITVVTEDETIEGKDAVMDGSPAPDGEHTVTKGDGTQWKIVCAGGKITTAEPIEAAPEPSEAMKKENAKLKADLADASKKIGKLETDLSTAMEANKIAIKNVNELKTEFTNFKKQITGDDKDKDKDKDKKKSFVDLTSDERSKLTPTQRLKVIQMDRFSGK